MLAAPDRRTPGQERRQVPTVPTISAAAFVARFRDVDSAADSLARAHAERATSERRQWRVMVIAMLATVGCLVIAAVALAWGR